MGTNGGHEWEDEHADKPDEETHPLWRSDRIELKSAGIDIGSTTSHLMFSEVVLRRQGSSLSSRFQIVSKKIVYESDILLTPFLEGNTINAAALSEFIAKAYQEAAVSPDKIDTGALILTGVVTRRDNAEAVASLFSAQAGKFVCATAGPNLEARMAAYGSGAVEKSLSEGGICGTVMNVDVGGGTSKVAIVQKGAVVDTAVINVGARLLAFDEDGKITRIEEAAEIVAEDLGFKLAPGLKLTKRKQDQIAAALANSLVEVLSRGKLSPLTEKLLITAPLSFTGKIDAVTFSGGVSEYIYGFESKSYGDMGAGLAREVKQRVSRPEFGVPVELPAQRIRATVIGASQYTVQVSGSTIFVSREGILPLRNVQVLTPRIEKSDISAAYITRIVRQCLDKSDLNPEETTVALAFHWPLEPSHDLIKALVKGVISALADVIRVRAPVVLVFDADIGRLVGMMLEQELGAEGAVVSIDGIELQDFDYIDIGEQLEESHVVPVVIKSLVFRSGGTG